MAKVTFHISCFISWLFFLSLYFVSFRMSSSDNDTDFRALLAFKKSVDSDPYGALSSWNETVHFCSWQGILCSQRHQNRVISVDLNSQGINGSISPHLGNLSFLRTIILQNNSFYGQIPDQIGRLRRLELIDFSNNTLSGEIPKNLSQCTNMVSVNLIDNHLTGPIAPELGSMPRLERLGLGGNYLSGSIPSSLGNLTNLIVLSLRNCGIQGELPDSLVRLPSLGFLILDDNRLSGTIPSGLYNMSTISSFLVRSNQFEGTLPSEIGFSPRLRYIDLKDNNFHGILPMSLSNFSMLEDFDLSLNSFAGHITIDFSRFSLLQHLILDSNNFEGDLSFILSMANCTSLTLLSAVGNLFSGSLPDYISNLPSQLNYLYLGANRFNGAIPSAIGNLINLTLLSLEYNDLEGQIPSSMGNLNKLQEVYLGGNRLTNEIPYSFGNLSLLNRLYLQDNYLTGNIPLSLSNCTNLLSLNFSRNDLSGSIPPKIMSLASISIFLDLSHNSFTGSIPQEVGSLINLVDLDLSHNRLSGLIPISLHSCVRLERIEIQNNSLNGELPDGLDTLRGLQYLDVSQNNLSGPIPRFLGKLDLQYLNLSFNRFQGEVPAEGIFLNESAISLEGNSDLCGVIPYLQLRRCLSPTSKKNSMKLKILIPVAAGVGCVLILACFFSFLLKYRKQVPENTQSNVTTSLEMTILRLSYADLLKATDDFSMANLVGTGKYGSVYKGIVGDERMPVAVKVLNLDTKGASKSFFSECNALRGIRHRNLVKLMSVCSSTDFQGNDFKAVVYEFKANGNLDEWLHEGKRQNLSLRQRLNITIDIASALDYLHDGTDSTIVHGDMKPSNILLDEEMSAHVGDFGLSKIVTNRLSALESSSAGIRGTIGYIPPEYGMSGMVSTRGDVYSYGILLLEMFTGRRPTDDYADAGYSSLHDLVRRSLPCQVTEIVDPVILREHDQKMDHEIFRSCLASVLEIGVACSERLPGDRMVMSNVVSDLRKAAHMV